MASNNQQQNLITPQQNYDGNGKRFSLNDPDGDPFRDVRRENK